MGADVESLCADGGALLEPFSLVIASQLPAADAAKLAATCERRALPLIVRPPAADRRCRVYPDPPPRGPAGALLRVYRLRAPLRRAAPGD